jgi:two-component system CheB/CheR fusion protein
MNAQNDELARLNDDLNNLFSGVNLPILMLVNDLRLWRFTPQSEVAFHLSVSHLGRHLSDL